LLRTLPNRVVMGSMHTGLEDKERDYDALATYFAERAAGGVGLIVTGGVAPNNAGRVAPFAGEQRESFLFDTNYSTCIYVCV
jgi:2,4-dienoyl-CoA reductase (NADPH2)